MHVVSAPLRLCNKISLHSVWMDVRFLAGLFVVVDSAGVVGVHEGVVFVLFLLLLVLAL